MTTQQQTIAAAEAAYRRLGVDPIINATGSVTRLGGTRTRPEVLAQMAGAARVMVNIDQLNEKAGAEIARLTGAEAGLVTSGAAGGLLLQAAACIAAGDPARMQRLSDDAVPGCPTKSLSLEHARHPRLPGLPHRRAARLVEIGDWPVHPPLGTGSRHQRALPQQWPTSAPHLPATAFWPCPDELRWLTIAIISPVIAETASIVMPPPAGSIDAATSMTAAIRDIYSGGKGVRGPQGTGILCGRADLIDAARANGSPAQFLGRPMKVAKEEILGLTTANWRCSSTRMRTPKWPITIPSPAGWWTACPPPFRG